MPYTDPETRRAKGREYSRKWDAANREKNRTRAKRWKENNPGSWRKAMYKRRYGMTVEQYQAMVTLQNGLCYICHRPPTGRRAEGEQPLLHVDHDHNTGAIRRLLCSKCNQAIGLMDDSPDRLLAAAAYLEEHVNFSR